MLKSDAIRLFGGAQQVANALGLNRSRISQWPEKLPTRDADRVLGAALRLGRIKPAITAKAADGTSLVVTL